MALVQDSLDRMGTKEKVESWIASTPEIQDPVDTDGFLFDTSPHWSECHQKTTELFLKPHTSPERAANVTTLRQPGTSNIETSCDSIFRKYFPAPASVGSKLIPGFQKAARRRQTVSLLRKHAFRWANITYKKFVIIRTDGCNMIPWTDVSEYFFPSCDDPACEIVLLALKYSLGYPKMTRHIHPCSQTEQLRFGDLFKVVQYGTILVDIDAVLANKTILWNMVEDMHASTRASDKVSKCSYKCPEKIPIANTDETVAANNSRPPSAGSVQPLQRAHNNSPCSRGVNTPTMPACLPDSELNEKPDNDLAALPHGMHMVEFMGAQATMMWNTMSEGEKLPPRMSKSFSEAIPSNSYGVDRENQQKTHAESSLSDHSIRNPDSGRVQFPEARSLVRKDPSRLGDRINTELAAFPSKPNKNEELDNTKVVGLRVNNNHFLPVIVSLDCMASPTQDISKWLVPVYLAQTLCLNTHVAGKLLGVYRDFIVGRSCQTAGKRGYARLCNRLEGRNLTRWLYNMSETAGLIPTWTIVTSRCLLIQWRDFLQYVPNESVHSYELDPSLSFQFKVLPRNNTTVPSLPQEETKSIKAPCNSAKTIDGKRSRQGKSAAKNDLHQHPKSSTAWAPPGDNDGIIPTSNWSTPLWEENELPSAQLREEELPDWAKNAFEEVDWTKEELPIATDPDIANLLPNAAATTCTTLVGKPWDGRGNPSEGDIILSQEHTTGSANKLTINDKPDISTEVVILKHSHNKKRLPNTEQTRGATNSKTREKKAGTPGNTNMSTRTDKEDISRNLESTENSHQSDSTLNVKPRKKPKGRPPKKRLTQSVASCEENTYHQNQNSYSSLLSNNKLDKHTSQSEVPQELVNPKLYEKFVHRRRHKEEDGRQQTASEKPHNEKCIKAESSQHQQNVSKSPRKRQQKISAVSKQCTLVEESSSKGKGKNRFAGLTLWGEEDEVSNVNAFTHKSKSQKPQKPKTPLKKTVSWHIPGIYPRPKQKKCQAVEKTSSAVKNKISPRNDVQNTVATKCKGGAPQVAEKTHTAAKVDDSHDRYLPTEIRSSPPKKRTSNAALRENRDSVEGKSSSLINNVSRDYMNEPGGYFRRRQTEQKDKPDPHVVRIQMDPTDWDAGTSPRLMVNESLMKTIEPMKDEKTIGKRFTLRSLSESKKNEAQTEISAQEHKCRSEQNTAEMADKESSKLYKRKREIGKAQSRCLKTNTSGKPNQKVKSETNVKGSCSRKEVVIKQEQSDSGFKIQVDRTEVTTETSSIIEQQKKLFEAIKKQRNPNQVFSPKKCILRRWNEDKKASESTKSYVGLTAREIKQEKITSPTKTSPRDCSIPSGRTVKLEEVRSSRDPDQKIAFSFQPLLDPGQTVSNRGLAFFHDYSVPYVAMNGYKYITLKDAVRAFPHCKPGCCVAKSLLRSHRGLHKTMCSWDQVYDFELTQPYRRPPVRTGDVLLRFDNLMTLLPALEQEIPERHRGGTRKTSLGCSYNLI